MSRTIDTIGRSLEAWGGPANRRLPFRNPAGAHRLTALDILIYYAGADVGKGEPDYTVFHTAGLSQIDLPGPLPAIELMLSVEAPMTDDARDAAARAFADFTVTLAEQRQPIAPPTLLRDLPLPPFENAHFLLVHPEVDVPETLGTASHAFALLTLMTIYESEIPVLEALDPIGFRDRLADAAHVWNDPKRARLSLT